MCKQPVTCVGAHSIYLTPDNAVSGLGVTMAGAVVALLICAFEVISILVTS